jgi:galactitol-specific phosphotransferase system IIB component
MRYIFGMTDAEYDEWQSWTDMYCLITNLHEYVREINANIIKYSAVHMDEYGMTQVGKDIYAIYEPVLDELKEANRKICSLINKTKNM